MSSNIPYPEQMLRGLNDKRLSGELTDVILVLGEREWRCHKVVLAVTSDYFNAMFCHGFKENAQERVEIGLNISVTIFNQIIGFIYTGDILVNEENALEILQCASVLQISQLRKRCVRILVDRIKPENCIKCLQLGKESDDEELQRAAKIFMVLHFSKIYTITNFVEIPQEDFVDLLDKDKLDVPSEDVVFDAVLRWVRHDQTRVAHIKEVCEHVRFPMMTPAAFMTKVEASTFMLEKCMDFIQEAKIYNYIPSRRQEIASSRTRPRPSTGLEEVMILIDSQNERVPYFDEISQIWPLDKAFAKLPKLDIFLSLAMEVESSQIRDMAATVYNNNLYVTGGSLDKQSVRSAFKFDASISAWAKIAPMSITRYRHKLVAFQECLFSIGGRDDFANQRRLDSVEQYHPQQNTWQRIDPLLEAVSSPAVATLEDKLYVIGGTDSSGNPLDKVQVLDSSTYKWSSTCPLPDPRSGGCAVTHKGRIYVIGGLGSTYLCYFDPKQERWISIPELKYEFANGAAVMYRGNMVVCGGYIRHDGSTPEPQNIIKAYDLENKTSNVWDAKLPFKALNHSLVTILKKTTDNC